LANELENENIEFLFVSLDQKKENWVKYLSDNEYNGGIHIWTKDYNEVNETYQMIFVPRYMMVSTNGTIIDSNIPGDMLETRIREELIRL
jgi:cytochrome oxidase Cu insertion factor (SCO1/SenC/PrrC family)